MNALDNPCGKTLGVRGLTSSPDAFGVLAGAAPAARARPGAAGLQQRILDTERSDAAGSRAGLLVAVDRDPGELGELAKPLARSDGSSPGRLRWREWAAVTATRPRSSTTLAA